MGVMFVGIPFYTLMKYRPIADAVRSLRNAGIVDRIRSVNDDLVDLGDVDCLPIARDRGPGNLRNFEEFLESTRNVKDKLAGQGDPSRITFCLGGDCAFVPGSLAGLKAVHRENLAWSGWTLMETSTSLRLAPRVSSAACL